MFKKKKKLEQNDNLETKDELKNNDDNSSNGETKNKNFGIFKLIFYVIVAALLLAFGILLLVKKDESVFIIFITTAAVTLLISLIRIFYILFKKEKDSNVRKVNLILSIIHAVIGIYLIIAGIIYNNELNSDDGLSKFSKFNDQYYPMFLAILLYSESVAYFMNTVLFKKASKKLNFWLHISFITIAVVILSLATGNKDDVSGTKIVVAIAIISFICSLISGVVAFVGYFNPSSGAKKKAKKGIKEEKDDNDEDNQYIDLEHKDDNNDKDSSVVM